MYGHHLTQLQALQDRRESALPSSPMAGREVEARLSQYWGPTLIPTSSGPQEKLWQLERNSELQVGRDEPGGDPCIHQLCCM